MINSNNINNFKNPIGSRYLPKVVSCLSRTAVGGFVFLLLSTTAFSKDFSDQQAIHAIMGEARGEPYMGKLYIACAIRNRMSLKGVYGSKAVINEPEWVWEQARKAWAESEYNRVTDADHWGSAIVDRAWIEKAKNSGKFVGFKKVGNHVFFKHI